MNWLKQLIKKLKYKALLSVTTGIDYSGITEEEIKELEKMIDEYKGSENNV